MPICNGGDGEAKGEGAGVGFECFEGEEAAKGPAPDCEGSVNVLWSL